MSVEAVKRGMPFEQGVVNMEGLKPLDQGMISIEEFKLYSVPVAPVIAPVSPNRKYNETAKLGHHSS